jgi:hypothetical protein
MKHSLTGLIIGVTFSILAGNACAVVFEGRMTRVFDIDPALAALDLLLFDALGAPTETSAIGRLEGSLTLGTRPGPSIPSRPEGDVARDGAAQITFEDILDFDLSLTLPGRSARNARDSPCHSGARSIRHNCRQLYD